MTISRGQMKRQLYEGGGIMSLSKEGIGGGDYRGIDMGSRTGFGILKKITRGAKKTVKKAVKGVKDIASSDLGKAALIYGATAGLGALGAGAARAGSGFGLLAPSNVMSNLGASFINFKSTPFGEKIFGKALGDTDLKRSGGILENLFSAVTGKGTGTDTGMGSLGKLATLSAVTSFLTKTAGLTEEEAEAEVARDPSTYLEQYYRNLNPPTADTNSEQYEKEVAAFVAANTSEYAVGGRVGFAEGPVLPPDTTQPVNPFGPKPGDFGIDEDIPIKQMASNMENDKILEALFEKYLDMGLSPKDAAEAAKEEFDRMSKRKMEPTIRGVAALGGKMDTASDNAMQAAGVEGLPVRQNPKGVKELDLRETGGFIQPVGIKEKADDIPAMLSNNEFVFTADAVRGAGGGNVELGAQRMYDTMKRLEAGGKV